MNNEIESRHQELGRHPMYQSMTSVDNIRVFMKYHVFAVWDFMTLLKSLQRKITCVDLPWTPSEYDSELVRLINEIVLGEESDIDLEGKATSHFDLYLKAMEEVGADTAPIKSFIHSLDLRELSDPLRDVVSFHLDLAIRGEVHEVASSFFFGREKLIPAMFQSMVDVLEEAKMDCPTLLYYLKRHIEVDGDEHGPKALACLKGLIKTEEDQREVNEAALGSLEKRNQLWNLILDEMNSSASLEATL